MLFELMFDKSFYNNVRAIIKVFKKYFPADLSIVCCMYERMICPCITTPI